MGYALGRFGRVLTSAVWRDAISPRRISECHPATMKALRKMRPQRGAQLESVGVPTIGPTDVLVRVRAASICGTDLHIYGWDRWSASRIHPPLTFGHEFCGIVEKVGDEVTTIRSGRLRERGDARELRALPAMPDGPAARLPECENSWNRCGWMLRGIRADSGAQRLESGSRDPRALRCNHGPAGNAVHTVLAGEIAGLNVVGHRGGADRVDGDCGGTSRRMRHAFCH